MANEVLNSLAISVYFVPPTIFCLGFFSSIYFFIILFILFMRLFDLGFNGEERTSYNSKGSLIRSSKEFDFVSILIESKVRILLSANNFSRQRPIYYG
jgi:hypothetical protein